MIFSLPSQKNGKSLALSQTSSLKVDFEPIAIKAVNV